MCVNVSMHTFMHCHFVSRSDTPTQMPCWGVMTLWTSATVFFNGDEPACDMSTCALGCAFVLYTAQKNCIAQQD